MFQNQQQRIREVCRRHGLEELADVLCQPRQDLEHGGSVTLSRTLPYADRGYHGDGTNKPLPPVKPPVVDGAVLKIVNQPTGNSDKAGENGFALDVRGPAVFDALWGIRWATVASTGTTAGGYAYSDGYECGNSAGDDATETPIRVFYKSETDLPATSTVIGYQRDNNGVPYAITGGSLPAGETTNDLLYWDGTKWAILDAPPTSGNWGLLVRSGTLEWVEYATFTCPETPATTPA